MYSILELSLPICAIVFSTLLIIIYFSKKRINLLENRMYCIMIFCVLVDSILVTIEKSLVVNKNITQISNLTQYLIGVLNKFDALTLILLTTALFLYIYIITKKPFNNELRKVLCLSTIFNLILTVFVFLSNVYLITNGEIISISGSVLYPTYLGCGLYVLFSIITTISNIKNITRKHIPLIITIIMFILLILIFIINPYITIISILLTFINYVMYFTIENPDMKLLKEVINTKEISDNANEEKAIFLYNMTQEIRNTTENIDNEVENILYSKSLEENKNIARNIREEIAKFKIMTNDILDVSKIDSASIKIYHSKYNLKLLLKTIISNYTDICKDKGLDFKTNIEHNIPDMLFGDNISLKNVINLLLDYSIENTTKGYIELTINTVIKNDICRLIISIEDSSNGINSQELESIKFNNKNINEAYKMITVMNGTIIISSNYGLGNKIKIILDQKIDKTTNEEKTNYQEYKNQKILVIDDNESSIKIIEKLVKNNNIILDKAFNGKDAIEKIKTKNKYDLILLDEELTQISGEELLKKLKNIRNFNTPIILLSKDNTYEYNNKYIEMGFNDILIKPIKKDKLLEKINNI